ncbi:MAG: D-2-hydroxyacid dehydrogenase [Actinobacteria bacterium]|nr:D-2-hydroxyacid dehydrogenase [Actinomycetota bacterium]
MRTPPTGGPIVLAILYPSQWFGGDAAIAEVARSVEALDPRVEVLTVVYEEGQHLRTLRGSPEGAEEARRIAPALTDEQAAMFARVHGVIAIDLPFDVAELAPNLAWVQGVGAGTAQLQTAGLAEAGIVLTSGAGTNAVGIAEFVIGRIIEERKRFPQLRESQRRHAWEPQFGLELAGTTVGLVGLGAINAAVAHRLQAFAVEVLACRRSARPGDTAPDVDALYPTAQLHEMLGRCDTVVAAVPETPDTIGLMDAAAFAAMPAGSFFVNVGRGTLVDEAALVDTLERGHLRGAAIDVASQEPLPPEHFLWDAPNLTISFHCSASPSAMAGNLHRLWIENVRRWLAGEELVNVVGG